MAKKGKKPSETPCKETVVPVEGKTPATVVLLLSSPEEDILIKASEAIHTFAEKGDENKITLLGLGALEPLCQLITHSNKLVRRNAFMALGIMAINGDVKSALERIHVIPSIIDKLSLEEDIVVHEFATLCLASLSLDFVSKVQIFDSNGLPPLIQLLDLHAEALDALANYLSDSESVQQIHESGGLTRLMDFFLTPNLPEIQSNVVKCITRVAQSPENRKLLHEQHVEKVLVEYLSVEDNGVKMSTCQAVAAMSLHLDSKGRFQELGGIPALVDGLCTECLKLREAATQALAILTHSNDTSAMALYEAGGHEILVQQLQGSCARSVANAAAALCNMAGQEVIRCSILAHGVMQALVEPMKSTDTQVLVNATLCLAVLACDTEARAELQSAGGLQPLVNLLRSYHNEVLQNACLAVNVCASDEPAAVEMCKFGALELLREINQSANRRSSFSELAMISLLNSNLSVKYSLTGHLAFTDIVSDGFYDAGQVRAPLQFTCLHKSLQGM
uniref:Armadillo repeat containing 3 n=1 Tax=Scophthalmus maximus TaxID=52904 RepID=A0A8D3DIV4_SCOMX